MVIDIVNSLKNKLQKAISGELLFDNSNYKSPGILINRCFIPKEGRRFSWAMDDFGMKYCIFSAEKDGALQDAFLYNDKDNNIIFEVGERFNWLEKELSSEQELIEEEGRFLSFIDNYEPIIREVIPQLAAKDWLENVKAFVEVLFHRKQLGCDCNK